MFTEHHPRNQLVNIRLGVADEFNVLLRLPARSHHVKQLADEPERASTWSSYEHAGHH
jgi:hypothetical protein